MTQFDESAMTTQCVVYDKTPGSQQKKINIVVRPQYTVGKLISDISTQFHYANYELLLQPTSADNLVHLNTCQAKLIYELPGFQPTVKNSLIIFPAGEWDGNVTRRYELGPSSAARHVTPNKLVADFINRTQGQVEVSMLASTSTAANATLNNNNTMHSSNNVPLHTSNNNNSMDLSGDLLLSNGDTSSSIDIEGDDVDSQNMSPMSDPEAHLSNEKDDLALGASASPTEDAVNIMDLLNSVSDASTMPYNGNSNRLSFGNSSEAASAAVARGGSNAGPALSLDQDMYAQLGPQVPMDRFYDYMVQKKSSHALLNSSSAAATPAASASCSNSSSHNYVGLVNQAMTCYLNSLLQALYMTPEFRNALYRWEFDNDNEAKNIPYQLQKLFLNLQMSKKSAVETTDLTRSFGWDSTEAWQQHDIQELCRVMFDALERKFMTTKQANLITNLYEGLLIDYVKCLECNTEKSRGDKFLDIPLPVRPFDSPVAYGTIQEALRAFVAPETLDGNNQYFCEKCNKKCDAHKGLKFSKFPYILTLHLKRFDFDYQTLHRIKLNDVVTFPQILNLNSFLPEEGDGTNGQNANGGSNTDDCSTTDSGSAMEEDNCIAGQAPTANSRQQENDMNGDEDEGIDLTTSANNGLMDQRGSPAGDMNAAVEKLDPAGPHMYELFAIMIHSGSATGGHYYAYIKEFESNKWFCFNDQSVSPITSEDIERSYGGGSNKAYYSSVYTSSTNAYMLMYRKIDPLRNERVMAENDFPEHIKKLLPKLAAEDEQRHTRGTHHVAPSEFSLPEVVKPRVFFYNPVLRKLKCARVSVSRNLDLSELLESAYQALNVERFAPISRCRLVAYDQSCEEILQSFENPEDPSVADVRNTCDGPLYFLLEYCVEGQEFMVYRPGGATWHTFRVNLTTMEMDGPFFVYSSAHELCDTLRHSIAQRLFVKESELLVATLPSKKAFVAYDPAPTPAAEENFLSLARAKFKHLIYMYINIPSTDAANLEFLGLPLDEHQTTNETSDQVSSDVVDAVILNGDTKSKFSVPLPAKEPKSAELNSSDIIDRIYQPQVPKDSEHANGFSGSSRHGVLNLVGDANNKNSVPLPAGQNSKSADHNASDISDRIYQPKATSPEQDALLESMQRINTLYNNNNNNGINATGDLQNGELSTHFFHAIRINELDTPYSAIGEYTSSLSNTRNNTSPNAVSSSSLGFDGDGNDDPARKPVYCYKILVDTRMTMGELKRRVEGLIGVPACYFKILRKHDTSDPLNPSHTLVFLNQGENMYVELGKTHLLLDEGKARISYMRLSEINNDTGKLPHVCDWFYKSNLSVKQAKQALVAKLHRIDAEKYKNLTLANCRLWLKGGRNPVKILADNQMLSNEVRTTIAAEFLIQECVAGQPTETSYDNSLVIFVRKWHPDTMELDEFQELIMERDTEMRNALSLMSGIPEEYIAYSKINGSFPCTNISMLVINGSLSWFTVPATLDKYPLTTTLNGNVYFYKDTRLTPKELGASERRKWNAQEKARLDRLGYNTTALVSPRRERALKIYMDSSPTSPSSTDMSAPSLLATTVTTAAADSSTAGMPMDVGNGSDSSSNYSSKNRNRTTKAGNKESTARKLFIP